MPRLKPCKSGLKSLSLRNACSTSAILRAEVARWAIRNWRALLRRPVPLRRYTPRRGIELFHRTARSGCEIETRQPGHADRIEACLAIDLVVAWRIFHLTKLGRETPDVPCTAYLEEIEWRALLGFNRTDPIPRPSLPVWARPFEWRRAWSAFWYAKAMENQAHTQSLWLGLQRLDDLSAVWKVFSEMAKHTAPSNTTYGEGPAPDGSGSAEEKLVTVCKHPRPDSRRPAGASCHEPRTGTQYVSTPPIQPGECRNSPQK